MSRNHRVGCVGVGMWKPQPLPPAHKKSDKRMQIHGYRRVCAVQYTLLERFQVEKEARISD